LGLGIGTFYMVWFGKVLTIVSEKWHFLYIAIANVVMAVGATIALTLKLYMPGTEWMVMMIVIIFLLMYTDVGLAFFRYDQLFSPDDSENDGVKYHEVIGNPATNNNDSYNLRERLLDTENETESANRHFHDDGSSSSDNDDPLNRPFTTQQQSQQQSTSQLLTDLLFWRRQTMTKLDLAHDECDVTSRQFYLIMASFVLVNATGTTFMANLGPITSNDSETEGSARSQVIVIVWACAGQVLGRIAVPLITFFINKNHSHSTPPRSTVVAVGVGGGNNNNNNNNNSIDDQTRAATRQSRLRNRTTLSFTFVIGMVFVISILLLNYLSNVSFVVASTTISVGYGMMWCTVSSYPLFFPLRHFTNIFSIMQMCGSCGTLLFTSLVSALDLDNHSIFVALLCSSISTVICTSLTFADRLSTEASLE
jgi:hypothetical protein